MTDLRAVPPAAAAPAALREVPVGDPAVPRMELREWAERYGVVAGITTRGRGFSLGLWSEENVGQVMTRWRAGRAAFGSRFPGLVLSPQIHGTAGAPGPPPPLRRPAPPRDRRPRAPRPRCASLPPVGDGSPA